MGKTVEFQSKATGTREGKKCLLENEEIAYLIVALSIVAVRLLAITLYQAHSMESVVFSSSFKLHI